MSSVRFVCTARGVHTPTQLGTWSLNSNGRARRVGAPDDRDELALLATGSRRNSQYVARVRAQGSDVAASTFDEVCRRCGLHPQWRADRFSVLVAGLIAHGVAEVDISRLAG